MLHAAATPMLALPAKAAAGPINLLRTKSIKLAISQPGWYRVSLSTLKTAGFNAGTGTKLHLYAEGVEQPFELNAAGVEFYGTGLDTPSTATRVYWLVNGALNKNHIAVSTASGARRGRRFPGQRGAAGSQHLLPGRQRRNGIDYFGRLVESAPLDETINAANLSRPDNATLEVGLQGVTAGAHSVTVELNGVVLDTVTFSGQSNQSFLLPASSIRQRRKHVTLTADGAGDSAWSITSR